jgi:flagellin-specific chaperone FliS
VQPDVIRAAVYNRAIAKNNPWIQHLEKSGFYDEVRKLLQKARATYKAKDPTKRAKTLGRELTKLQALLNILEQEKINKSLSKEYGDLYGKVYKDTYDTILDDKIARLQNEIARTRQTLQILKQQQQQPQVLVPQ